MAQEIADSTLLDTWSSGGNIVEPDISKIIEGWQLGEQPPHEYMNWLQNTFGSKLNHILKNGVASWNNTTQYLVGSSVQYGGNVWLCKTTNTNSEPADVNANWKRIITVESLATVLGGYVALTDFTGTNRNLTTNGYQKLPGGLIIQWGYVNTTAGTVKETIWPIAFPNGFLGLSAVVYDTSPGVLESVAIQSHTQTQFSSFVQNATGTAIASSFRYIAVGY